MKNSEEIIHWINCQKILFFNEPASSVGTFSLLFDSMYAQIMTTWLFKERGEAEKSSFKYKVLTQALSGSILCFVL